MGDDRFHDQRYGMNAKLVSAIRRDSPHTGIAFRTIGISMSEIDCMDFDVVRIHFHLISKRVNHFALSRFVACQLRLSVMLIHEFSAALTLGSEDCVAHAALRKEHNEIY